VGLSALRPSSGWTTYRRWLAAVLLVDALLVAAFVALDAGVAIRPLAVFLLVLLGPGLGFTGFLDMQDALAELAVAVPISLACDVFLAGLISVVGAWEPDAALGWYSLSIAVLLAVQVLWVPARRGAKQRRPSLWPVRAASRSSGASERDSGEGAHSAELD